MTWLLFFNQSIRNPVFDVLMPVVSFLLGPAIVLSVVVAVLAAVFWRPEWRGGVKRWVILLLVLSVINFGLKKVFHQPRPFWQESGLHYFDGRHWHDLATPLLPDTTLPHETDNSFPSGHTTLAFGIIGYLWSRVNKKWKIIILAAGLLMAVSRVYLGVHYPIDVAVGGVLGWLIGYSFFIFSSQRRF